MLALSDILLALLIWGVAYVLQSVWGRGELSGLSVATVASVIVAWVGLRALLGLYPGYGLDSVGELRRHTYAVLATLAALAIFALGFQVGASLSRLLLASLFLGLLILAPFTRYLVKRGVKEVGLWGKPVVILGYKETGTNIASNLEQNWGLGYDPVAVFNYRLDAEERLSESVDHHQVLAGAVDLAREQGVDTVIFAMPYTRREQLAKLVSLASINFQHILIIPNLNGLTNSAVMARDLAGTFAVEVKYNLLDPWSLRGKRALDLSVVVIGGILLSPLLAAIAVMIKLDSPGPALFVQERPGRNGRMFKIFKFRTMHTDAEQRFAELSLENPLFSEEFEKHGKLKNDPRVTTVGRWLRKFSLDELPQLWNILKGEMSLIGPRPYLTSQRSQISGTEKVILRVPPGVSGLWQVSGRSDTTLEERVGMDVYYVHDWSVWLDIVLLVRTMKTVLLGRGAY
jgi:Undecaprenyl-phosphate galactose phosphotransferase WbaP